MGGQRLTRSNSALTVPGVMMTKRSTTPSYAAAAPPSAVDPRAALALLGLLLIGTIAPEVASPV